MQIVITMAGVGQRFRDAGYNKPKYEIEVKGKTLFEWSMMSLLGFNDVANARYFFVVRLEDVARDFILDKMAGLGINNIEIIEIDGRTDGQATSAFLARGLWDDDDELIIYNIDTYVEPGVMKHSQIKGDGWIPCFNAPGEHWSFVRLGDDGRAVEVREKRRVSDNCTVGLYYFRSCRLYEKMYNEYYAREQNVESGEKYVAPIYNLMIQKGLEVRITKLPTKKVHILGTPEEMKTFEQE